MNCDGGKYLDVVTSPQLDRLSVCRVDHAALPSASSFLKCLLQVTRSARTK